MNTMQEECTYLNKGIPMPFCKGCGHSNLLRKLDEALTKLQIAPQDICLVTDIGCIGLADYLFDKVHSVHTTHGRSTAFATGISLADKVLAEKKLKTIVLIGDGGSMIGLLHIVNAALLNTDITVIVANNFLFGMTGGQQSALTPLDFITQTSPLGNIIPPLDICNIAISSKAEFVARKISTDKDLSNVIADAILHQGFSLIEVIELCTEYAVSKNELRGNMLSEISLNHNHQLGLLKKEETRLEFGKLYKAKYYFKEKTNNLFNNYIKSNYAHSLEKQNGIVLAGSAGEKVQSSAAILCETAANCNLNTTQKNDNPVTQGTGFSISEIILSPYEINYTGVEIPDAIIIVSNDGLKELKSQNRFNNLTEDTLILIDESINLDINIGKIIKIPFRKLCGENRAALGAIHYLINKMNFFPIEAFENIVNKKYGEIEKLYKSEFINILNSINEPIKNNSIKQF